MGATYKKIEIVGTSDKGVDDAIKGAIKTASKTVKGISWFETTEIRGAVKDGEVMEYQVVLKAAFKVLED